MNKLIPATLRIKGTCTEYVLVDGFNDLALNGVQGANIQQPSTNPQSNSYVLSIRASVFSVIVIGGGSTDVRLQSVTTDGSWGVVVYENSQVWLKNVTTNLTSGFAAVSAFDKSDVHVVDGLLQRPSNSNFNAGLLVSSGHVTVQGLTIRDMQQSININNSGSVDLVNFDPAAAGVDVVIDNPSGTNVYGVVVSDGSSLNLGSAKLRISNAGQAGGGDSGAVFVTNGSTLNAGPNLVVSGSLAGCGKNTY